jgi:hypothetical protein
MRRTVVREHLGHRAAGLDDQVGRQALAQQVLARDVAVGQVDVGRVVDDAAVDLLGHAHVEAAVAGLHVEDRHLAPLGRDRDERAVGVAEHQQRIGLARRAASSGRDDDLPIVSAALAPAAFRKRSGLRMLRSEKKISFSS